MNLELPDWLTTRYVLIAGCVLLALLVIRAWRRAHRRRRPVRIHPKLQKYAGPSPELLKQRRMQAEKIIATSSTDRIAGYEIVEQVEAVFVEGFRSPEEAIEGLKAAAALKGANALINLRYERAAAGRCSASGDAVVVRRHPEGPAGGASC